MSIFEKNKGTKLDPYEIWTEDDLFEFSSTGTVSSHFLLKSDITMTREWTGVNRLDGSFDGGGHTIRGLKITGNSSRHRGFVGNLSGEVTNLTLEDTEMTVSFGGSYAQSYYFGGISSQLVAGGSVSNIRIINLNISTSGVPYNSEDRPYIGSISGSSHNNAVIKNCIIENFQVSGGMGRGYSGGIVGNGITGTHISNVIIRGNITLASGRTYRLTTNETFNREPQAGIVSGTENRNSLFSGGRTYYPISFSGGRVVNASGYNNEGVRIDDGEVIELSDSELTIKSAYDGIFDFGPEEELDMVDGELPYPTLIGTRWNPRKIKNKSDLSLVSEYPNDFLELVEDIELNETVYRNLFSTAFYGVIEGNGFGIHGISIKGDGGRFLASFSSFRGEITNTKFHYLDIDNTDGGNYSTASIFAYTMYGEMTNCAFYIEGDFKSLRTKGVAVNMNSSTVIENNYFYINNFISVDQPGRLLGEPSSTSVRPVAINNIFHVGSFETGVGSASTNFMVRAYPDVRDNVVYIGEGEFGYKDEELVLAESLEELRNPDFHGYDNFDKDKWVFFTDKDPIPSPFYVIVEKIEERLISLYSKGISLKTRMSKGFKDIIKFFSKKSESDVTTKRIGNRLEINFSETISSKFSRAGKKLREIKNYTGRALSNFKKSLSVNKRVEFYTEGILSRINNIKMAMKSSINKMNKINFNVYSVVIRRYLIGVMTYSKEIISSSSWTKLIRVIKTAKSYTRGIRSLIWRFTNVYEFVVKWASSYSSPISSSVVKHSTIKRLSRTYTESISSYSRRLVKRSMSALKYAKVNVRYNNTKMRVKESMTKIRAFSGGGD